jgi:hypothetical protein
MRMNSEQIGFLAAMINYYGCGQHPVADRDNISGFTDDYIKEVLTKALNDDNLSELGQQLATDIIGAL